MMWAPDAWESDGSVAACQSEDGPLSDGRSHSIDTIEEGRDAFSVISVNVRYQ